MFTLATVKTARASKYIHAKKGIALLMIGIGLTATVQMLEAVPPSAGERVVTNALAVGTPFAMDYYIHDSGKTGPTVLIIGGMHGNERAGSDAAEAIRHWPLSSGKLVVVPRANVAALSTNQRLIPGVDTNLNNLNRNFPRAGKDESPRGILANAIWNLALNTKPDWLLDLHEGYDFNRTNSKSVGSSIIASRDSTAIAAANAMLEAVNATIPDADLKFTRRSPPIDGSFTRAAAEHLHIPSMILETTTKQQSLVKRSQQHQVMAQCLLARLKMVGENQPAEFAITGQRSSEPVKKSAPAVFNDGRSAVRVALYQGPGTGGAGPPNLLQRLNNKPDSSITTITPDDIRSGSLTNYDVVIFGGGSGSKQAEALGPEGRAAVQQFVAGGGGYIGICAGAYLATSGYPWSLSLINARTVSPKWQRGKGTVRIELTEPGNKILGDQKGEFDVLYANGPVVKAADSKDLPPFKTLAFFRTELAKNDSPVGVMVNAPAIFSGVYKRGQVVCISPHPEQTKGLEEIVPHAVAWVAPKPSVSLESGDTKSSSKVQ